MKDFLGMLSKIMKIGQRKRAKPAVELPIPTSAGLDEPTVTVNHASRAFSIPSQPAALPSAVPPNPGVVEVLPLLNHVPLVERHILFIRKLHLCTILFDFSNTAESALENKKEIKGQTLAELIDLVRSRTYKMNEIMQEELVKMISVNIFRCLPPRGHENAGKESGEGGEDNSFMDPSWPHLQLVYELLLKYVESKETDSKIAKRYINHTFVSKLLDIFDSEDSREREYLKTILHRIYGKFMVHRPYIRNLINNVFYRFIFETERHNGICELLEILGSIINGFALPMREEHKIFLVRALIPLHKPKNISVYHSQLSYCITQYVEKDYRLADTVIRGLLKYWPLTNCLKEVLFILELEEVLEVTQPMEFHFIMVPLFRQVGRCINSPHFQVAERALFLWNNDYILELIAQNRHVILPIIFDALENNSKCHWNQTILALTANVQRMFVELDSELVEDCERKYNVKLARVKEMEEQRAEMWRTLEEVAAKAGVERKVASRAGGEGILDPKVTVKGKIPLARKSTLLSFW